jgi:hypothetical protein
MMFLFTLALSLPAQANQASENKDVKILGQAAWPFVRADPKGVGKGARVFVIRGQDELIKASGLPGDGRTRFQLAGFLQKAFKLDKIDYAKHMLVVITGGTQPSGGFSVEATKARSDGKILTLDWKLNKPSGFATTVLTHPAVIVLLDRFDGMVRFNPSVEGKKKE